MAVSAGVRELRRPVVVLLLVGVTAACTAQSAPSVTRDAGRLQAPSTSPSLVLNRTHWVFESVMVAGKRLAGVNGGLRFVSRTRYRVDVQIPGGCSCSQTGHISFSHTTARFRTEPQRVSACEPGLLGVGPHPEMQQHGKIAEAFAHVLSGRTRWSSDGRTLTFTKPGQGRVTFRR